MSNARARLLSPRWVAGLTVIVAGLGLTAVTDAYGDPMAGPGVLATTASPAPTNTTPNTSPFPPAAPTGLVVTAVTSTSVTLSWTAATPGCCPIAGYEIGLNRAFDDVFHSLPVGNVTTATVTSTIQPASEYNFRVSARDTLGHTSGSSNVVITVTPLSDTGPDAVPPSAPTNLRATGTGPGGAALTWSPSTDNVGVTGYNVYRFDGLFVSTLLATVPTTSYTVPLASPPNLIYVRARDAVGNLSIASNPISASGPTGQPPSSPPVTPPACRITYTGTSQWQTGFVADLTIANTGQTPVAGWTLGFTFRGDQHISQAWNAVYSQAGAVVTLRNADWNATIPPGGSTSFGILGSWGTSNAPPTAFTLNGAPCTVG